MLLNCGVGEAHRGNPACRRNLGGRRKAVRDRFALQGGTRDLFTLSKEPTKKIIHMAYTMLLGAALLWRICYLVLHCHTIIFQLLCQPPQYVANLSWEESKSS